MIKTQTIRYGENGGVEIIDIDVSDPQAGEVQVRHAACGVCAWDLATFRDGGYAPLRVMKVLAMSQKLGAVFGILRRGCVLRV